jgi:hypothetical protein
MDDEMRMVGHDHVSEEPKAFRGGHIHPRIHCIVRVGLLEQIEPLPARERAEVDRQVLCAFATDRHGTKLALRGHGAQGPEAATLREFKKPERDMLWRWMVMRSLVLWVPLPTRGRGMMKMSAWAAAKLHGPEAEAPQRSRVPRTETCEG